MAKRIPYKITPLCVHRRVGTMRPGDHFKLPDGEVIYVVLQPTDFYQRGRVPAAVLDTGRVVNMAPERQVQPLEITLINAREIR